MANPSDNESNSGSTNQPQQQNASGATVPNKGYEINTIGNVIKATSGKVHINNSLKTDEQHQDLGSRSINTNQNQIEAGEGEVMIGSNIDKDKNDSNSETTTRWTSITRIITTSIRAVARVLLACVEKNVCCSSGCALL